MRLYRIEYAKKPDYRDKRRAYEKTPEFIARRKVLNQTPSKKDKERARGQTIERKLSQKEYRKTANYKERMVARSRIPEINAKNKERSKTDRYKQLRKARAQTPENKAKKRARQQEFGGGHYRRAVKRGGYAERFKRADIFKRDNLICEYCKKKMNIKDCVLDHRIPIAKGGSHTPGNCTTSCFKCNAEKHANLIDGVQITIFDRVNI